MSSELHTSAEYIKHHLQNLTYGRLPDGVWGVAHTPEEARGMGFWSLNLDTVLMSLLLGVILMLVFRSAAKNDFNRCAQRHAEFLRVGGGVC